MEYISIYLANLGRFNESWGGHCGEWVKLPVPEEKLTAVLKRIGIGRRYEEYFIPAFETSFANLEINEYSNIYELNDLAQRIAELASWEVEKLAAVVEVECPHSTSALLEILDHLDEFDYLADIEDEEALGQYYAEMCGTFQCLPDHLQNYIDFASYGRDIHLEGSGTFSSYGYVVDLR